jgi:hypothetical protein
VQQHGFRKTSGFIEILWQHFLRTYPHQRNLSKLIEKQINRGLQACFKPFSGVEKAILLHAEP